MAREIYQAIVDGILIGGVYALMAVGLTLSFGVLVLVLLLIKPTGFFGRQAVRAQ